MATDLPFTAPSIARRKFLKLLVMGTLTTTGRARSVGALFAGVALLNTATVGLSTAATLIVAAGSGPGWSGLPSVANVLGTAAGALGAGLLLPGHGRRRVLTAGYAVAAAGAVVAFAGALTTSLVPLLLGILLVGLGNAARSCRATWPRTSTPRNAGAARSRTSSGRGPSARSPGRR